MPSSHDLLEDGRPADPGPAPDDVLRSIRTEGGRRRTRRHRRNAAAAVLGLALLVAPAVGVLSRGDGPAPQLEVAADGRGTVADITPDVSLPAAVEPVPAAPEVTGSPALPPAGTSSPPPTAASTTAAPVKVLPGPAPSTTATTARACRNSSDPACGDFRWDPPPSPNQPLVASFTKAPSTAAAGQPVAFEVAWSDADAALTYDHLSTDGTALATACSLAPRFGPWTPPAAVGGSGTLPYTATFAQPGTYRVVVSLGTASCTSPYGSDKVVETTVTVGPAVATG